jgi:hypothetical protein
MNYKNCLCKCQHNKFTTSTLNLSDRPDYILPETGAMLFYTKKHTEGYDIDKITFTSLDEDYCVSLIESVMDSKDFAGWPFGK